MRKSRTAACAVVGLGVSIALYGLIVWSPGALFARDLPDLMATTGLVSSLAYGATLLSYSFPQVQKLLERIPKEKVLCALLVLSLALWTGVACTIDPSPLLTISTGAIGGIAVAGSNAAWVSSLPRDGSRARRRFLLAGALLASVLSCAPAFLPGAVATALPLVLIAVEAALSWGLPAAKQPNGKESAPSSTEEPARNLVPIVLTACVIMFVAPLVNTVLMVGSLAMPMRLAVSSAMSLLVVGLLTVLWLALRRDVPANTVLFGYVLLLACTVALVWIVGLHVSPLLLAVGSAGFFLVTYILMDSSAGAAHGAGLPVSQVYGAAAGSATFARVIADQASEALLEAGMPSEIKTLATVFLLIYLVTWAAFFLINAHSRQRDAEKTVLTAEQPPADPSTPPAENDWSHLAQRCDAIARDRGLSHREHEILALMMRGRNVPAIAEELTLSRNTVQTHVRHVYEHLGVHSRQELVAFVDAFDAAAKQQPVPGKKITRIQ